MKLYKPRKWEKPIKQTCKDSVVCTGILSRKFGAPTEFGTSASNFLAIDYMLDPKILTTNEMGFGGGILRNDPVVEWSLHE